METLAQAIMVAGKAIGAGLCMGIGAIGPGVVDRVPDPVRPVTFILSDYSKERSELNGTV